MDRRDLLRATLLGAGTVALPFTTWPEAYGAPAQSAPGPYGALRKADVNGVRLPAGFTSRVIARSGQRVPGTTYTWHSAPDGGAVFADGSGWTYVSNSEMSSSAGGGASRIRFDATGAPTSASRILGGTNINCAGGATPWRTWLPCEEVDRGHVWETYPLTGVDNIIGSPHGDLFVAEDGGNMEVCVITPNDQVFSLLRVVGHTSSEITGLAFNPAGNRLYFSSQRGTTGASHAGITFCVTGPFRHA